MKARLALVYVLLLGLAVSLTVLAVVGLITPAAPAAATGETWATRAAMPTPRDSAATVAFGGKVYVIGGSGSSGAVATVEAYDPATNSWSTRTPMPTAKALASAAVIATKIYVLGSDTLVYAYDPANDSWASVAPIPQPANGEHGLGAVNGKLYVAMGSLWLYAYDPVANTWTAKTPVPVERSISSFATLNGKLYAIGGGEPGHQPSEITRVDVYDPATDSWQIGPIPDMPTRRTHMGYTAPVIDGNIYVIGGWDGYTALSTVDIYDSVTNSWSQGASMPTARYAMGFATVDARIYVIGGNWGGSGGHWLSTNEELTVSTTTPTETPTDTPTATPTSTPTATPTPLPCWQIETVDSAGSVGSLTSLALDAAGLPRISYSDDGNIDQKYASFDGTAWQIETVDSAGDVGVWNSLDLDSFGRPHIAYLNAIPYADDLKYAYHDGTTWQIQTVDSDGFVGGYARLRIDSLDRPHIAYYDPGHTALKYAHYLGAGGNCGPGNTWQCSIIDNSGNLGEAISLVLGSADRPHISYYIHYGGLKYTYYDGTAWQFEVVDSAGNVGTDTSIDVDSADRPHIAYRDYTNGDLKYAWYDGIAWQIEVVDSAGDVGALPSLVLDAADRPHISYVDLTNSDLKYAWYDGTTWHFEVVDSAGNVGGASFLALDAAGRAHISYYDATNADLKYARMCGCDPVAGAGFSWIPTDPSAGEETTFTGSATGTPPISYAWDLGDGSTAGGAVVTHTYANAGSYMVTMTATNCLSASTVATHTVTVEPPPCQPVQEADFSWGPARPTVGQDVAFSATVNSGWRFERVTGIGGPWYVGDSLALDAEGHPHVSYFAWGRSAVEYAWNDGTAWYTDTVASGIGEYAGMTSLALDHNGRPHITYNAGRPAGNVIYAWYDGSAWQFRVVGSGAIEGICSALVLDSDDHPHVIYHDWSDKALKYSWYDGSSWQNQVVDNSADVGGYCDLAMDSSGHFHASYTDWTHGALKHAWSDGSAWSYETVETIGQHGAGTAITLDTAGRPHIAYCADFLNPPGGCDTVRYASRDDTAWTFQTLEDSEGSGSGDLVLDTADRPHIIYYDASLPGLVYAYYDGSNWQGAPLNIQGGYVSLALDSNGLPRFSCYQDANTSIMYAWLDFPTPPLTYTWSFGDGSSGSGVTATHVYTTAGTYTVVMAVTNPCGQQVVSRTIVVAMPEVVCPTCETDADGNVVAVVVNENVTADFNVDPPACSGDPDLCACFTFDKSGPTPDTWKAIFSLGGKKLVVQNGATISVVPVPPGTNNRKAPGIEIRSTCELVIAEGGAVVANSLNQPAGPIWIQVDGNVVISGTVSDAVDGTNGFSGEITIASSCGDVRTGPMSQIKTVGQDPGGRDINLLTDDGDILIAGLVDASYKGGVTSTVNIVAFNGAVTIDGNNLLGIEPGTQRRITSGVTVRSRRDPLPGRINIQARGDITALGNVILNRTHENYGAVAIHTASSGPKGGIMDVRSLDGRIVASDRAFDNANKKDLRARIYLLARGDILLSVTSRINDGAGSNAKSAVSSEGGFDGDGGVNTLRSYSSRIVIGDPLDPGKVQVRANSWRDERDGQNFLTSCSGVYNNGVVDPADGNPADDSGVCTPPAPVPLFLDSQEFGVMF